MICKHLCTPNKLTAGPNTAERLHLQCLAYLPYRLVDAFGAPRHALDTFCLLQKHRAPVKNLKINEETGWPWPSKNGLLQQQSTIRTGHIIASHLISYSQHTVPSSCSSPTHILVSDSLRIFIIRCIVWLMMPPFLLKEHGGAEVKKICFGKGCSLNCRAYRDAERTANRKSNASSLPSSGTPFSMKSWSSSTNGIHHEHIPACRYMPAPSTSGNWALLMNNVFGILWGSSKPQKLKPEMPHRRRIPGSMLLERANWQFSQSTPGINLDI